MIEALSYGFMQKALIGGIAIAIACALVGPFLVLRRLSLLGDGIAHFAFGGIALGLLFGINPLIAALLAGVVGVFIVEKLTTKRDYGDAAIALILSIGVGLGVIIIGIANGFTVDLFSFLIGSILALSTADLIVIYSALIIIAAFIFYYYNDLLFLSFNEELAMLRKRKISIINSFFLVIAALAVVVGIRAVGILLVTALIVLPTLIALEIAKSFKLTIIIAVISSFVSVISGILIAYYLDIPPSGAIVFLLFIGFVFAYFWNSYFK